MSTTLTLLPVDCVDEPEGDLICNVGLEMHRRPVTSLFHEIKQFKVEARVFAPLAPIPEHLFDQLQLSPYVGGPFQNAYMGLITETAYNQPLYYVFAGDICTMFKDNPNAMDTANIEEKAALGYIKELKENTKVILYWW